MSEIHEHLVDPSPAAARLHEVVDGVFAWVQPDGSWWINNAGAVSGDDGTIIVDTCATEERTRRFLDAVREATDDAPVRFAANTHEHGDHTYGNCLLPTEAALIGHANMRDRLLVDAVIDSCPPIWEPVPDWGNVTRRVPNIVTHTDLSIFTGSRRVDLKHPGYAAHTTGDLVAWLPEERVVFTGDLIFHGLTPLVLSGSVEGALHSVEWLATFDAEHLVPGHGPLVSGNAELADVLGDHERYYRFVMDLAVAGRNDGISPLHAAQQADLSAFAGWADPERLVLNLHRAYCDLGAEELDIVAAFLDAITFNGGPLTTHVCCLDANATLDIREG
ncbi:MAG TPA: MBL fold metallo-hydrolase [Acidimicrobiales bacterium]